VKRNNNSQVGTIKQRFRERNNQNRNKDNSNLNNKNSIILKKKTGNMSQEGEGHVDEDVIDDANQVFGPANGTNDDNSSNNDNSSQKEMRIVKCNDNDDDLSNFVNLKS
jgi:hypothetical protein